MKGYKLSRKHSNKIKRFMSKLGISRKRFALELGYKNSNGIYSILNGKLGISALYLRRMQEYFGKKGLYLNIVSIVGENRNNFKSTNAGPFSYPLSGEGLNLIFKMMGELGWSQQELSRRIGTTTSSVNTVLKRNKGITYEMFCRLKAAFSEEGMNLCMDDLVKAKCIKEVVDMSVGHIKSTYEVDDFILDRGWILNCLNEREQKVVDMYLDGKSYREISKKMHMGNRYAYGALESIVDKVKKAMEK